MITSSAFAQALLPGINEFWGRAYEEYEEECKYLFDTNTSSRAYEEDVSVSGFGMAQRKNEGEGISYDSEQQGFTTRYSHVVYGLGFVITREMFEDDQYDVAGERKAQSLAFSMRQTKEINGANVYNRGFNSSYLGTGANELLATDHPNIAGGTYSNKLAVDADLSEAALEQAVIDIEKMTNDRGLRIALKPKTLIIPVDSKFLAERILLSNLRPGTANNDLNALNNMSSIPEVVVNHYLTDTNAWFIRTNNPHGMKHWERRAIEFGVDNDFDSENAKFKATERYSFGWTDPRGLFGSEGA